MKPKARRNDPLIERLKSLPMSEAERATALALVRRGEAIADFLVWATRPWRVAPRRRATAH
jgi:hypothetical protein